MRIRLRDALAARPLLALAALTAAAPALAQAGGNAAPAVVQPADIVSGRALKALGLDRARLVPVAARVIPAGIDAEETRATLEVDLGSGVATEFTLKPYAVRSPGFTLTVVGDDGVRADVPAPTPGTFRGFSPAGDEAWASIVDGRVRAVIVPAGRPDRRLYVQPVADGVAGDASGLHAVYAAEDVTPVPHRCGLDDCPDCAGSHAGAAGPALRGPATCRVAEVQIDCDYPFYQANQSSAGACVQDVEAVMLLVNQIYFSTPTFVPPARLAVRNCTVRTTAGADPYNAQPLVDADAGAMLGNMRTAWPPAAGRDITHLFTGRDLNGSTIGLAYVGAFCGAFNVGLSQTLWSANLPARATVTAHEIGHNWGMQHDSTAVGTGFVMNASASSSSPQTQFSTESVGYYNANIANWTCTTDAYADVQPDGAVTLPGRPITIDVLANDGLSAVCATAVAGFTLPSTATTLGGTVAVSVGTGPGGRNQVAYTPPAGASGVTDTFSYTAAGVTVPVWVGIVAPRQPDGTAGSSPGLNAAYYDLRNSNGSVTLYPNPPTDYSAYPSLPGPASVASLNFPPTSGGAVGSSTSFALGAVFTGYVRVPTTDYWTFYVTADDVARVSIGGQVVALESTTQAAGEASGSIALAPGLHAIRVDFNQYAGTSTLVLSYSSGTQPKTVVPASAFFRVASTPCPSDFNGNGSVELTDIFAFLNAWFGGCTGPTGGVCIRSADFNNNGQVDLLDIFAFLNAWFGGC